MRKSKNYKIQSHKGAPTTEENINILRQNPMTPGSPCSIDSKSTSETNTDRRHGAQ